MIIKNNYSSINIVFSIITKNKEANFDHNITPKRRITLGIYWKQCLVESAFKI